jgi:outer membrane protein assembly factor BamB
MQGHDPQRTSRSPATGPTHPHLLFTRRGFFAVLIGPKGDLYGTVPSRTGIVALDAGGRQQWAVRGCCGEGSPVLAADGTVFDYGSSTTPEAASTNGTEAIAIGPAGTVAWRITPFGLAKGAISLASNGAIFAPVIGPHNGTGTEPYIGLNVISWQGRVTVHLPVAYAPALAPNGTIYEASIGQLTALAPGGAVVWQRRLPSSPPSGPLVGQGGIVYLGYGTKLVAYSPSGRLLWSLRRREAPLALAERADGVVLMAGRTRLSAVSATGKQLWTTRIGKTADPYYRPFLVVDASGKAYVGSGDGRVRVVTAGGHVVASLRAGPAHRGIPTALLGPDGKLIVSGTDGVLRAYGP